ncbi:MAG: sigma-70 family RNA polymerase sigma factor [Chloroflexi bacterium]|nr:sigma-70 family RNA polymerase sigma factor [Chloroflexota bacterium]
MTLGQAVVAEAAISREDLAADALFEEIFEQYQDRIYNCVYRLVGNSEEAYDLTQETFVRAYAALPKISRDLKVGPWLYRIATNLCMDQLRRRKLIRWEPLDNLLSMFHPKQVARDNPEREVMRQESREVVHEVLDKLPPKYRTCLVLREYQDMSCEEIAQVMGTTRSAVKSLLFRAREEFRSVYEKAHGNHPI